MKYSDSSLLDVRDLKIGFKSRRGIDDVVSGVSFSVKRGETVALVGESGSGKSVTAFSILRLLGMRGGIASGEIIFNSPTLGMIDLLEQPLSVMRSIRGNQISMIFQEPMTSLNPLLTIGYQIAEVVRTHRNLSRAEARREALTLLDKVEIPNARRRLDEYPLQLSGGMRQRVVIAMALACHPTLLIADEPTTALDVTTQAHILEMIRGLQREMNMSVLLITHDLGLVAENADRALVMYCGDIVEDTNVDSLFYSPSHPYTLGLLQSMPATAVWYGDKTRLSTIPGSIPAPEHRPKGCVFAPRCEYSVIECEQTRPVVTRAYGSHAGTACHRAGFLSSSLSEMLPWVREESVLQVKTA